MNIVPGIGIFHFKSQSIASFSQGAYVEISFKISLVISTDTSIVDSGFYARSFTGIIFRENQSGIIFYKQRKIRYLQLSDTGQHHR